MLPVAVIFWTKHMQVHLYWATLTKMYLHFIEAVDANPYGEATAPSGWIAGVDADFVSSAAAPREAPSATAPRRAPPWVTAPMTPRCSTAPRRALGGVLFKKLQQQAALRVPLWIMERSLSRRTSLRMDCLPYEALVRARLGGALLRVHLARRQVKLSSLPTSIKIIQILKAFSCSVWFSSTAPSMRVLLLLQQQLRHLKHRMRPM